MTLALAGFEEMPDPEYFGSLDDDETDGIPPNARPEIRMSHELADNVDSACKAMRVDRNVYHRNAELVHIVRATPEDAAASSVTVDGQTRVRIVEGTPSVHPVAVSTLRERLTRVAVFKKYSAKGKGWKSEIPTNDIVSALHTRRQWPGIRELAGIIETPSMRPDGALIVEPGYDRSTKFLYSPTLAFPPVPDAPTQAEAAVALRELVDVFSDFPFASEPSRYVPIAALLTLIARPAIVGAVPAFLFDAPTPGTGKSLCADAVSIIATGRGAPRGTFPPQVEELEKVLSAYALRGAAVIGFDNLDTGFGGAPLDKVLTASDTVDLRVLGQSQIAELRWLAVILVSGNNLVVLRDTARRVLISRLESTLERPEERTGFSHYPLIPWVQEQRARLVVCALTVLRAYVVAGRPSTKIVFGSFEGWSALIAEAIVFAGGANVLGARPNEDAGDSGERGAIAAILAWWPKLDVDGKGLSVRTVIDVLYPKQRADPHEPPDGFDGLREAIEEFAPLHNGRPDPKKLGNQLRRFKRRIVGGAFLVQVNDRKGVAKWTVQKTGGAP
ncbi:MAG: hypothetical protein ABIP89_12495 [Polyangiaceae bacterium]